jgi:hypothetical protein
MSSCRAGSRGTGSHWVSYACMGVFHHATMVTKAAQNEPACLPPAGPAGRRPAWGGLVVRTYRPYPEDGAGSVRARGAARTSGPCPPPTAWWPGFRSVSPVSRPPREVGWNPQVGETQQPIPTAPENNSSPGCRTQCLRPRNLLLDRTLRRTRKRTRGNDGPGQTKCSRPAR